MNKYGCPICGYEKIQVLDEYNHCTFEICECCGCESGSDYNENSTKEHVQKLLTDWTINKKFKWHSKITTKPNTWNPLKQMENSGIKSPIIKDKSEIETIPKHYYKKKMTQPDWFNLEKYEVLTSYDLLKYYIEVNERFRILRESNLLEYLDKENVCFTDFFKTNILEINTNKDRYKNYQKERIVSLQKNRQPSELEITLKNKAESGNYSSVGLITYEETWESSKQLDNHLSIKELIELTDDEKELIKLRKKLFSVFYSDKTERQKIISRINTLLEMHTKDYFKKTVYDINYNELHVSHTCLIDINIDAEQTTLENDFKQLVEKLKKQNNRTLHGRTTGFRKLKKPKYLDHISPDILNKWIRYKALEFFDLIIHFAANGDIYGKDYSLENIAVILFSEYANPTDTLFKYTIPCVNEVFNTQWTRHVFHHLYSSKD